MAARSTPNKIISASAKAALIPLGFQSRGARVYRCDHGFWTATVWYQPSSFSKGTYLNCLAHWLWGLTDNSEDYGGRVNGFVSYEDDEQFTLAIELLTFDAVTAALKMRKDLRDIAMVAAILQDRANSSLSGRYEPNIWRLFDASVAAGLAGNIEASRKLFSITAMELDRQPTWLAASSIRDKLSALLLSGLADDRERLLALVAAGRCRAGFPSMIAPLQCS